MHHQEKVDFLKRLLGRPIITKSNTEAVFFCPFCNHHNKKLSINLESNIWQCWVCKKSGGRLDNIVKKAGTNDDLREYRQKYHIKKHDEKEIKKRKKKELDDFVLQLPKGFRPLVHDDSFIAKNAIRYLKSRGFTYYDMLLYKIGICIDEFSKYNNRIIFPSFDKNGNLNYFCARTFSKLDTRRKYETPHVPSGYMKTIIVNELNVDFRKPILLVEGIIDSIKAKHNSVPLMTNHLKKDSKLVSEVVKNDTKVYVGLDSDACKSALKIAMMLTNFGIDCHVIDLTPHKDFGEINDNNIVDQKMNNAKLYKSDDMLYFKIKEIA